MSMKVVTLDTIISKPTPAETDSQEPEFVLDIEQDDDDCEVQGVDPTPVEKTVPFNIEAEEAVLGALLIDSEVVYDVQAILKPGDFYIVKNGWVYEAILELVNERQPVDFLTLSERLEANDRLQAIGGVFYISTLINSVPTAMHCLAYANIIANTSMRRRLITAASQIAALAYREDMRVMKIIGDAESVIAGLTDSRSKSEPEGMQPIVSRTYDEIEQAVGGDDAIIGIPTGYVDLDKIIRFEKKNLFLIAGRPGMGKSALMMCMALHNAQNGHRPAFFSMEMSKTQMARRILAIQSGIASDRLRRGDILEHEWGRFQDTCDKAGRLPVFIDDTPGLSPMQLLSKVRRLIMRDGIDIIYVDYLQLMDALGDGRKFNNSVAETTYLSGMLVRIAMELDIPVVAGSQLSRACEQRSDKRPIQSDLRDSGSLEQDSAGILFIYRDEEYDPNTELKNIAEVRVAKNRNGATGTVHLFFRKHLTQFVDAQIYHRNLTY